MVIFRWSALGLGSLQGNSTERVEDQQGWNLGFVWRLLVIHKRAFGRNNGDPGQQSLSEQLVQYNAQSCPYQNGSCQSPKRSHQGSTISVWRSSLRTDRWRCYGVPSRALISKLLHVIYRRYPWAPRKTSILLPSTCWWHAHCNAWFSNSNYFPAYPQQCPHFKFTMEVEKNGKIPFLGTELFNHAPRIETKVYVKLTNTDGSTITLPKPCRQSLQTKLTYNYAWSRTPIIFRLGLFLWRMWSPKKSMAHLKTRGL